MAAEAEAAREARAKVIDSSEFISTEGAKKMYEGGSESNAQ